MRIKAYMKLLVIADDLTGGLDTGVQFALRGISSRVLVDQQEWQSGKWDEGQVLILDTETRGMEGTKAYQTVKEIVHGACEDGITYIYKKTDSGLRGNIGYELQAVLDGQGAGLLHYVPAYPRKGRVTRQGIHYVDGVPVAESMFGSDLYEPVRYSYIPDIIHEQSQVLVEQDTGQQVPDGKEKKIRLYNATDESELDRIARQVAGSEEGGITLMAGCAGFAEALCRTIRNVPKKCLVPGKKERFLAVIGSIHPMASRQVIYAMGAGFQRLELTQEQLAEGYWEAGEGQRLLETWREKWHTGRKWILDAGGVFTEGDIQEYVAKTGIPKEAVRHRIADCLGTVACALMEDADQAALLATGGDTLAGVMRKLKVQELKPRGELLQEVVYSEFTWKGRVSGLLSKSGSFGGESLLADLAALLLGEG